MSLQKNATTSQHHAQPGLGRRRFAWDRVLLVFIAFVIITGFAAIFHKKNAAPYLDRDTADIAQVSRNIAEGKGFTTRVVRPFNLQFTELGVSLQPELNHAPLYPYLLAASFRVQGISDQVVTRTSLVFLIFTAILTCALGSILFSLRTGILAAVVLSISAPVLQIAGSGHEWMMTACLFTLLILTVAAYRASVDNDRSAAGVIWLVLSAVAMASLYYTSYPLAFLALPVAGYYALTAERKWLHTIVFLAVFALLALPLAYRNASYTKSPVLGAATWDLMANTAAYPADTIYRTTDPTAHSLTNALFFPINEFGAFTRKLASASISAINELLPMLGWMVLPLAITSLLYAYRDKRANSVRGLLYILSAVALFCIASYGTDPRAIIILAPPIAVYASAYLVLLVKSKKMPEEFRNWLLGGFVLLTAAPALAAMALPNLLNRNLAQPVADSFFAENSANMPPGAAVYTDVPWTAAWRTLSVGVWLPMRDSDIDELSAAGFPMQVVILTPESGNYPESEIWYTLHKVRLWRDYIANPNAGFAKIVAATGLKGEAAKRARQSLARFRRGFSVSQSIAGFQTQTLDPLATDDIQVLLPPRDR